MTTQNINVRYCGEPYDLTLRLKKLKEHCLQNHTEMNICDESSTRSPVGFLLKKTDSPLSLAMKKLKERYLQDCSGTNICGTNSAWKPKSLTLGLEKLKENLVKDSSDLRAKWAASKIQ